MVKPGRKRERLCVVECVALCAERGGGSPWGWGQRDSERYEVVDNRRGEGGGEERRRETEKER